jgi:hypothetical protein
MRLFLGKQGFGSRTVSVGFVVDKVTLGKVLNGVPRLSSVSVIPPVLHTHSVTCHNQYVILGTDTVVT